MPTLPQAIAEAGSSMTIDQKKRFNQYEKERKQTQKDTEDLSRYGKEASEAVKNRRNHDR